LQSIYNNFFVDKLKYIIEIMLIRIEI